MKNYLVFDIGTGNTRVALVNSENVFIGMETFENEYLIDNNYEDAQYFVPTAWRTKICTAAKKLLEEHPRVKISAITSSGARQSIVLIDRNGEEFYGLPNIDNRGKLWVKTLPKKEEISNTSGRWVTEDFAAAKLLGFKKMYDEQYENIYSFTSLSEWIAYIFTNELCIEPSQACETQLYDIDTWGWSKSLVDYFDLNDLQLPKVIQGGSVLGSICEEMKNYLGISYDIPFIVGGADTQIAILGAGIKNGDIGIISGTTSPVVCVVNERISSRKTICWTDCFVGSRTYMIETNPGVTGLNYQRSRKLLFDGVGYEKLESELSQVKSIKCIALFSSLDFENARSFQHGGFLLHPPLSTDFSCIDMLYAIVADIACSIYYQCLNLSRSIASHNNYILGCGGGFQSAMLCQHLANLTQKELWLSDGFSQASSIGCVKLCSKALKVENNQKSGEYIVYKPNKEKLIHTYYSLWCDYRKKLTAEECNIC